MIVAFPYSPKDEKQAHDLAHWIQELGPLKNHMVLHTYDKDCDPDLVKATKQILGETFGNGIDLPVYVPMAGWPQGPNAMFRYVATIMQNRQEKYWLWLEPDAAPLKEGWLDIIEKEYLSAGKPFMGGRVQGTYNGKEVPLHMTGIAVYPNPLYDYAGEAYRAFEVAWDIAGKDQIIPKAHFTGLFCHAWNHPGMKDMDELYSIPPAAVIHHGVKDGSLLRLLRERRGGNHPPVAIQAKEPAIHEAAGSPSPPSPKPITAPDGIHICENGVWVLEGDMISGIIKAKGRLDADELIPKLLPYINKGDTVIDIGAFVGDHAIAYADKVGFTGKVIAFEPNELAYEALVHNMEGHPNVVCERRAVGDTTMFAPLAIDHTHQGGAFISSMSSAPGANVSAVLMVTLDDTLKAKPDFIKIDVEGYELRVLKGAERVISDNHPVLALEINYEAIKRQGGRVQEIFDWLETHGYSYKIIQDNTTTSASLYDIVATPAVAKSEVKAETPPNGSIAAAQSEPLPQAPPLTYGEMIAMILRLRDFAAQSPNHRLRVMKNLSANGLTPKKKWTKKQSPS